MQIAGIPLDRGFLGASDISEKIFEPSGNLFPPDLVYTGKTTRGVGG